MNFLPKEIENIILDYKYDLEKTEKLSKCLKELINTVKYVYCNINICRLDNSFFRVQSSCIYRNGKYTAYEHNTNELMIIKEGDLIATILDNNVDFFE